MWNIRCSDWSANFCLFFSLYLRTYVSNNSWNMSWVTVKDLFVTANVLELFYPRFRRYSQGRNMRKNLLLHSLFVQNHWYSRFVFFHFILHNFQSNAWQNIHMTSKHNDIHFTLQKTARLSVLRTFLFSKLASLLRICYQGPFFLLATIVLPYGSRVIVTCRIFIKHENIMRKGLFLTVYMLLSKTASLS